MRVIFLVDMTVPPKFVDHDPKLRVLILAIGPKWPKTRVSPEK